MRLATHNPIGQNNKCSLWTLHQYEDEGTTGVTSLNGASEMKDGKFLEDEKIIVVKNNNRYNLKGQKLR